MPPTVPHLTPLPLGAEVLMVLLGQMRKRKHSQLKELAHSYTQL